MTVYVDPLLFYGHKHWQGGEACHMATDQQDLTELHDLAEKIGMARKWFQNHKVVPHYDLSPSMRERAIEAGAVEVSAEEYLLRCRRVNGKVIEFQQRTALEVKLVKVPHKGHGSHLPYATAQCPACGLRKRVGWRGFQKRWLLMCSCGQCCYIFESDRVESS